MLIAKINFYDKENNLALVKAGDEVKAKTKAVSYTHLDVYKRQIYCFGRKSL